MLLLSSSLFVVVVVLVGSSKDVDEMVTYGDNYGPDR